MLTLRGHQPSPDHGAPVRSVEPPRLTKLIDVPLERCYSPLPTVMPITVSDTARGMAKGPYVSRSWRPATIGVAVGVMALTSLSVVPSYAASPAITCYGVTAPTVDVSQAVYGSIPDPELPVDPNQYTDPAPLQNVGIDPSTNVQTYNAAQSSQTPSNSRLMFYNDADYNRLLPAQTPAAPTPDDPIGDGGGGAIQDPYWNVLASPRDSSAGRDTPIRHGDLSLGYEKANYYHNLNNLSVMSATVSGSGNLIDVNGLRYKYRAHVLGYAHDGKFLNVSVIVIVDRSTTTARGQSPDHRVVGMITAYCDNYTYCPQEVNTG